MKFKILIILFFFTLPTFSQSENHNYFKGVAAFHYNENLQAISYISKAIKDSPEDYTLYIYRGDIFYAQNLFEKAISDYRKAEKLNQGNALLPLAKAYSQLTNADSSVFFLKEYLEKYNKKTKATVKLDQAFLPIKNTDSWKNLWTKDWYSKPAKELNRIYYLIEQQRYIEAINDLNLMLQKNKKNYKAYFLKAEIYVITKNYKNAVKNYSKAIKYRKNDTHYYLCRARAYSKLGRKRKAIKDYDFVLQKQPRLIKLYYERALIYSKLKKYELALQDITLYIKYFYKDEQAIYDCGLINYYAGNYLNAIKYYSEIIELNPAIAKYYSARADAYLQANTYKYAIDDYNTALDLNPNLTKIYYNRGYAKLQNGDSSGACSDWQISLQHKDYRANNYIIKYCKP